MNDERDLWNGVHCRYMEESVIYLFWINNFLNFSFKSLWIKCTFVFRLEFEKKLVEVDIKLVEASSLLGLRDLKKLNYLKSV